MEIRETATAIDYEFDYSRSQAAAIGSDYEVKEQQQQQQTGGLPGVVSSRIGRLLGNFVDAENLGWVCGADTDFKWPGLETPRRPDVAFVSIERLQFPDRDAIPISPDLAVEVFSKTDSPYEMLDKVQEYLAAGVQLIWVVNPVTRVIEVYKPGDFEPSQIVNTEGELTGDPVLKRFKLKVSDIFSNIPEQAVRPKPKTNQAT